MYAFLMLATSRTLVAHLLLSEKEIILKQTTYIFIGMRKIISLWCIASLGKIIASSQILGLSKDA